MKLTQKGQVTIPNELRKRFGWTRGTEVAFEATEQGVLVRTAPAARVERLRAALEAVSGSADGGRSTAEVMALTRD